MTETIENGKIFSLNNIRERKYNLKIILPNILAQCDFLFLNVIGYKDFYSEIDQITKKIILENKNKVLITSYKKAGCQYKFYFYEKIPENTYYFTIDDDIIYPIDYSEIMIEKMKKYNNECICCVYGKNIDLSLDFDYNTPKEHYKQNKFSIHKKTNQDNEVMIPGTGTSCIHKNKKTKDMIKFSEMIVDNMSDYYLASFCKKNKIKIIAIERYSYWLYPIHTMGRSIHGINGTTPNKEIDKLVNRVFKGENV